MGNLCGKETNDNFSTPGRTLSSAPPQPKTAPKPKPTTTRIINEPPRTLGSNNTNTTNNNNNPSNPGDAAEARRKAAEAAEARNAKTKAGSGGGGRLKQQLDAQKKMSRNEVLDEVSRNERRIREVDEGREARVHN